MFFKFSLSLLFLLFALPFAAQAQPKLFTHIEISGGSLFDFDQFEYKYPSAETPYLSENNYNGFNYVMLGLMGQRGPWVYALEVEARKFDVVNLPPIFSGFNFKGSEFDRSKSAIQLNVFVGEVSLNNKRYQFIYGPMLNFRMSKEDHKPTSNFGYNVSQNLKTVGLGIKFKNQVKLSKNVKLIFGTRILVFDLGSKQVTKETRFQPTTTVVEKPKYTFDFFRDELVINVGLQIAFHKLARTESGNSNFELPPTNNQKIPQRRNDQLLPPPKKMPTSKDKKKRSKIIKN